MGASCPFSTFFEMGQFRAVSGTGNSRQWGPSAGERGEEAAAEGLRGSADEEPGPGGEGYSVEKERTTVGGRQGAAGSAGMPSLGRQQHAT